MPERMKIGIIGAGISGLTAAFILARDGHDVEVVEREADVGGLVSTFNVGGTRVERYYHFLCGGDEGYFALCRELGIEGNIRFKKARTGFYYEGREYPFTSPLDLLRFTPIPFTQRLRFGLFALEARLRKEWVQLDELVARPWLIDRIGQRAYEVIWEPLLGLKFGGLHTSISAAWVWHRLHRVARSRGRMGYLEGGATALLLDTLLSRIGKHGGTVRTGVQVERIEVQSGKVTALSLAGGGTIKCGRVISTVPLPVIAGLLPDEYAPYAQQLRRIQYIGVVCAVFRLARSVTRGFWLNVHDSRIPCNGIIELTNLNNAAGNGAHIVYVPYYLATDAPLYQATDDAVFQQSWDALRHIAPDLSEDDLLEHRVFRAPHAQAICPTGFLKLIPNSRSPIHGLRLLDSVFLYPEDRTQSGLILKARACVKDL